MPSFSIIIPHFDIPDLLIRCLKSIPVSEDIQVIVVDDNSPDADTYLERYPELSRPYLEFIRTTKGGGAGYARNVGLDHAKGKWLLFADADDFFVEDMYNLIFSYTDSEADVIYFKKKSVLSDDISVEIKRDSYINQRIDQYLTDGDERPIRTQMWAPWGKMIKRNLIDKYQIRFDEVMYSNDVSFSLQAGFHADRITVDNRVLYVVTYRPHSLTADFCSKPDELRTRADVAFRADAFLFRNEVDREHMVKPFLWRLLKQDRKLFRHYFLRLDEVYPSKLQAINDLRKGHSFKYQVLLYIYAFWLWITH